MNEFVCWSEYDKSSYEESKSILSSERFSCSLPIYDLIIGSNGIGFETKP